MASGKPGSLSKINQNSILELLRKKGAMSRADISRELEMSFPSVSSNVKKLILLDLIKEAGAGSNMLGRKSTLLCFNDQKGFVLGIDAGRFAIRAMTATLLGDRLSIVKNTLAKAADGKSMVLQMEKTADEAIKKSGKDPADLLCIVIGIPGIRDDKTGRNLLAPYIDGWEDIDLKKEFEKKYATKVMIENSVDLGAIAEKWKGAANGHSDIVYINYGIGIGCSVIINGELIRGANNAAGETGFMLPDLKYMQERFDKQGALEKLISGRALMEKAGCDDMKDVFINEKLISDMISYFSMMLIGIVSVLNPELLIISGGIGEQMIKRYKQDLIGILGAHVPFVPKLLCSMLGDEANVTGAIAVCLRVVNSGYITI